MTTTSWGIAFKVNCDLRGGWFASSSCIVYGDEERELYGVEGGELLGVQINEAIGLSLGSCEDEVVVAVCADSN